VSLGDQTTPGTEGGSPTVSPGGQTPPHTEAGGPIARTCATPSSTLAAPCASPMTSAMPHVALLTPPAPRATPVSMTLVVPPTAPLSQLYPLHYSHRPQAAREPSTSPLHKQSPPVKAIPVAPPINPHPMTTWAKRGFRLPIDRLTLSATSASTLLPVPSSVRAALIDPNWCHTMEEEFASLIANNTCDLIPHPVGSNVITDK
jgi:hypothetical protein